MSNRCWWWGRVCWWNSRKIHYLHSPLPNCFSAHLHNLQESKEALRELHLIIAKISFNEYLWCSKVFFGGLEMNQFKLVYCFVVVFYSVILLCFVKLSLLCLTNIPNILFYLRPCFLLQNLLAWHDPSLFYWLANSNF